MSFEDEPSGVEDADAWARRWQEFWTEQVARGHCPDSGLLISDCKSWLCDCFDIQLPGGAA